MYKICRDYALSQGKVITKKAKYGEEEFEKFDKYIPNNPKLYKLVITDHIALIEKERGFTDKQAIDKWSEYIVKYLRNRYKFTCIDIQQQALNTCIFHLFFLYLHKNICKSMEYKLIQRP